MIRYIAYAELGDFYSIQEVCHMLEMSKDELRKSCEKYNVKPSQMKSATGDCPAMTCADCIIIFIKRKRVWLRERTMIHGHKRTSHRG